MSILRYIFKNIKSITCLMVRLVSETSSSSTAVLSVTDSSGVVMDVVDCSHYRWGWNC